MRLGLREHVVCALSQGPLLQSTHCMLSSQDEGQAGIFAVLCVYLQISGPPEDHAGEIHVGLLARAQPVHSTSHTGNELNRQIVT